jgi:hypothetical protein
MVVLICCLVCCFHLKNYIKEFEEHPNQAVREINMMGCFVPILILACFAFFKILFFRVNHFLSSAVLLISTVSMVFAFESHFDQSRMNAPLFVVAIPFCFMLLAFTFETLIDMYYEEDYSQYIFKGYDHKHKQFFVIYNCFVTLVYVIQMCVALYCLEQKFTNNQEDKAIIQWNLFSSLIYLCLIMEASGSLVLNLVLDQFNMEVVSQVNASKMRE